MAKKEHNNLLPIFEFDELVEIFGYTNTRAAKRAVVAGTFPVPTFKMAGRTVAHADALTLYFQERRTQSLSWLNKRYGIDPTKLELPTEPRLDLYRRLGNEELSKAAN